MNPESEKVVVRMAPSPTGNLHIGTARTTLFNYLFAKKNKGKFILRIEDTDKTRSTKEFEDNILDGLKWLGFEHDEFYRQSEREEVYKKYTQMMIDKGYAYISKEELLPSENEDEKEWSKKGESLRDEVIRYKNPNTKVSFEDMIRGTVEFDTTELGDFVIAKSLDEPLYHLAVVIDDFEMGVTHVIRGEDHISNTPRQILIQEAIGATRPIYAHIPLILDSDRKKLSKRKHGEMVWLDTYKAEGYLPEAVINYLALLGWNPGTEQEIFTIEELVEHFDISKVQKGGAIFDVMKLRWVNKEHLKRIPEEETHKLIHDILEEDFPGKEIPNELIKVVFERIEILSDIHKMVREGELNYFFEEPVLIREKISWKTDTAENSAALLREVAQIIKKTDGSQQCDLNIMAFAESRGKGSVLWPLRYALSGKERSPDPLTLLRALGKVEALKRIDKAVQILNEI
jgi:nondiscriminating glutamyl-tRNA synthetase